VVKDKEEPEQIKTETDKEGEIAAEAPDADEQPVEQETEASEEEADAAPVELTPEQREEQLVKENEELQDKLVRLMADFDNYRKRASKEKSDVIQFGNEGLLKDILPVIDNVERLLTYSYREGSWKSFQEGVELLLAEINKTLAKYGVEAIEALGKVFDPNIHQAMQRSETDEVEANTVVEVFQKGYLYRSRLLRPSLVVVAVPPKGEEEEEGEEGAPGPDDPDGEAGDKGEDEEQPIN
jgi:molecular chaperone GrpE